MHDLDRKLTIWANSVFFLLREEIFDHYTKRLNIDYFIGVAIILSINVSYKSPKLTICNLHVAQKLSPGISNAFKSMYYAGTVLFFLQATDI